MKPPTATKENRRRIAHADDAIRWFLGSGDDLQDALCDLLADMMHWAHAHGINFDEEVERAREHYEPEREAAEAEAYARAAKMTDAERRESASKAARERWAKPRS